MSKRPDPEIAVAENQKDNLMFSEDVKAPQNVDEPWYKNKGTLGMLGLSVAWAGATIHYLVSSGWWAMRYEMTPPEFFSFITGILFPVAFIWIAGSYLTGYARNEQEAKKLRRYMHAFMFPSSKNKIYSKTLIEGLKEQIAELNDVYAKIQDSAELVEKRLKEVEKLSQHMNDETQNAVEKITESSEQVMMATNFLAENADEKITLLKTSVSDMNETSDNISAVMNKLNDTLFSNTTGLKQTQDALTDETNRISQELREQTSLMRNASENARAMLTEQTSAVTAEISRQTALLTEAGTKTYDMLSEQIADISEKSENFISALTNAGTTARDSMAAVNLELEEQTASLINVSEKARLTAERIADGLDTRAEKLERIFDEQNELISGKDESLAKTAEKISQTFKDQNTLLDQEAEKILARFKTVEGTLDLYTKEIGEVADTAIEQINGVAENLNAKKDVIASAADAAPECSPKPSADALLSGSRHERVALSPAAAQKYELRL